MFTNVVGQVNTALKDVAWMTCLGYFIILFENSDLLYTDVTKLALAVAKI